MTVRLAQIGIGLNRTAGAYTIGWQGALIGPWPRHVAELAEFLNRIATNHPLRVPIERDLLVRETLPRARGLPADRLASDVGVPGLAGVGRV